MEFLGDTPEDDPGSYSSAPYAVARELQRGDMFGGKFFPQPWVMPQEPDSIVMEWESDGAAHLDDEIFVAQAQPSEPAVRFDEDPPQHPNLTEDTYLANATAPTGIMNWEHDAALAAHSQPIALGAQPDVDNVAEDNSFSSYSHHQQQSLSLSLINDADGADMDCDSDDAAGRAPLQVASLCSNDLLQSASSSFATIAKTASRRKRKGRASALAADLLDPAEPAAGASSVTPTQTKKKSRKANPAACLLPLLSLSLPIP